MNHTIFELIDMLSESKNKTVNELFGLRLCAQLAYSLLLKEGLTDEAKMVKDQYDKVSTEGQIVALF